MAEAGAGSAGGIWPAEIVHVNEDGWVLVNRGIRHGVVPGLRLLVVGDEPRELLDVAVEASPPTLLRIRRTYELLEVVHAEEQCAVAIATRVPRERRPQFYRAPGGELLVWVPLPPEYTWPGPATEASAADDTEGDTGDADTTSDMRDAEHELDEGAADEREGDYAESLAEQQEDDPWEQALPLNGLNVGDLVLPAIPVPTTGGGAATPDAAITASTTAAAASEPGEEHDTPFDAGRDYDWLKPPS